LLSTGQNSCSLCEAVVKENPNFLAIEARARKSVLDENTNLAYYSHDQLTSKYRDLKEKYQGGKLSLLNAGRRLLRLTSTMDQYERIQVAIASMVETGSYVRVHAIIANCHKAAQAWTAPRVQ